MLTKYFWQNKLERIVESLKKRKDFKNDSGKISAKIEFDVMSGFYIIRKLIEHKKLTNKFISTNIKGYRFPSTKKKMTPFNDHKWTEFYDFEKKEKAKFDIKFLCNQFIHSFYFIPTESFVNKELNLEIENLEDEKYHELCINYKRKYDGILFNSDDKKEDFIYELNIEKIIAIFEQVSKMDITKSSIIFNSKKNRYDYFQSDEIQEIDESTKELIEQFEK